MAYVVEGTSYMGRPPTYNEYLREVLPAVHEPTGTNGLIDIDFLPTEVMHCIAGLLCIV